MKEKAIIFMVGLLSGAVISICSVWAYIGINSAYNNNGPMGNGGMMQMPDGNPPDDQDGQTRTRQKSTTDNETPPEKPAAQS
jgi:hypothetical protein